MSVRGTAIFGLVAIFAALQAGAQTPFTEEASSRGIGFTTLAPGGAFGVGVGMADLDGDHDPDIFLISGSGSAVAVLENDNGTFLDRTAGSSIPPIPGASGVSMADYDGDGDLDIYVSVVGAANRLFRNDGGFEFKDETINAGVGDTGDGHGCAWADYDGDGWPDLYVGNYSTPLNPLRNRLYRNLGNGTFQDVAPALGLTGGNDLTLHTTFLDFNMDGRTDLYLCNDKANPSCSLFKNRLYRNDGGTFTDITAASGTQGCVDCMGIGVGDIDGNGMPDMYATNVPDGNIMLMNQGDETFVDEAVAAGIASYATGWGNLILDYDNDAELDVWVVNSDAPNRLYDCNGSWPCSDVGPAMGVDSTGSSYCMSAADIDGDGDLDFLEQTQAAAIRLYVNQQDGTRHWLKILLAGSSPNTSALGSIVHVSAGGRTQFREVTTGVGFKSTWPATLHFGLGATDSVDRMRVDWHDGLSTTLSDVSVDQLTIVDRQGVAADGTGRLSGLTVAKLAGTMLELSWGAGCASDATDYAVYEGALGAFETHEPALCSTLGATTVPVDPEAGSRYFVIVPQKASFEGSHGAKASDAERPRGAAFCKPQLANSCL